jgi:hypothetical protein
MESYNPYMFKICPNCGVQNRPDATFCPLCGSRLEDRLSNPSELTHKVGLFANQVHTVDARKAAQPLYVLWLLRDGHVRNFNELLLHFGEDPSEPMSSVPTLLKESLEQLLRAGLIDKISWSEQINVTDLVSRIRGVIGYSFTELAQHDPRESILVSPVFGLPRKRYSYDLFVLMPFHLELQPVYEDHIKAVAGQLNMSIARADDFFTTHSVVEEVWSAIMQSMFLIADCTNRNPNVFYEIGMAHSIGKPVVLITQNVEDVPFDLRHRRFLKYEYSPRGMRQFESQLMATLVNLRVELGK